MIEVTEIVIHHRMPRLCTAEGCVVNTAEVLCYRHQTHCNTCKKRLGGGSISSKGKCNRCRCGGLCKHYSGCHLGVPKDKAIL